MATLIALGGISLLMVIATVLTFAVFWLGMFTDSLSKQKEGKLVLFLMVFVLYLLGPMQETIHAAEQPDLIMTDVSPAAGTVNAGATLSVDSTVQNQGTLSAGGFKIGYRLSTNTVYGDGDDVVITTTGSAKSLAPGASSTATTSLKIPKTAAGSYHVCAMADSASKVVESNEANNTFCSTSQVTVPAPDLIMSAVSPAAGTVNAGATLSVDSTVQNQGTLSAGGFKIGYRLSTNTVYGDGDDVVITTTGSAKSLAPGASSTATTSLKIPKTAAGSYHVCAMADSASKVVESNEANNTFCSTSQVTVPAPDLIMSAVSPAAGTVNAGATLSVDSTVQNQGTLSAGGFKIGYRLSTNTVYGDGDDVVITTTGSAKSLAPGASNPDTAGLKIPKSTPAGTYYVCAMADSDNKVIETDEANNSRCTGSTITVTGSGTSHPDANGTLLYSVDSDEGFILWHKIVVDEDGDAMALWDVANTSTNISSVWASYYSHTSSQWGQVQKISGNDIVSYFSLPEAKFDQNGDFVIANTGGNLAGFSSWWNRFSPASGWGIPRTLPDGREAFGVNTRGEIFSQKGDGGVARYNTNTDVLTPDFSASQSFSTANGHSATFADLDGDLLAADAHVGITAVDLVVSFFFYTPAGGWGSGQFDTPVLTFQNSTGIIPLQTAIARDDSGHIAVVVAGRYCVNTCTTHWFVAGIYFDGAQWGNWNALDSSTEVTGVSEPSVKIDDQGNALAFWSNTTNFLQPKLRAARYNQGSGWGAVTNINTAGTQMTSGPSYPGTYTPEDEFTMDGNGDAVVSWMDQVSGFRIRENRFHPATGWAEESLVRQFPISMTGGAYTPKAQVNSSGNGFRTWVWLSIDPKTFPHTFIYTYELRAAPVTTP